MSLLLKALSRVDQREPVPPVEARNTAVEPLTPIDDPSIPHENSSNPAPEVATSPLETSIGETLAPNPAIDSSAPPDSSVRQIAEMLETATEKTEPAPDSSDPAPVDQIHIEPSSFDQAPIAQPAAQLEAAAPMAEANLPAAEPSSLTSQTLSANDEIGPLTDEPAPSLFDAMSGPEFHEESPSEPLWRQLDKLHQLVSADIDRFNFEDFQTADSNIPPVNVTKTEILEIDAIQLDPPSIDLLPENRTYLAAPSATAVPPPLPWEPPFAQLPDSSAISPFAKAQQPTAPLAPLPAVFPPSPAPLSLQPSAAAAPLNIKPEFRELRDQLLARLNLAKCSTLLLIDAGRNVGDASWLLPLAASIIEKFSAGQNATRPQILLVEAAGSECGISQSQGLDVHLGLTHVLAGRTDAKSAIQSTPHPQIKLLGRGAEQFRCNDPRRLAKLWAELTTQFNLILVAAGPQSPTSQVDQAKKHVSDSVTAFFPLATAAILCIELNGTPQVAALDTKQLLDARGIQMLGCIVQPT